MKARKCYICGPNANYPFRSLKVKFTHEKFDLEKQQIQSCDDFKNEVQTSNFNERNSAFIVECPSNFSGCLTFINETITTRTCEEVDVKDCKVVNNIKYCICDFDLCNINDIEVDLSSQVMKHEFTHFRRVNDTKETISVSDIKLYHLLYNTMKPALLINSLLTSKKINGGSLTTVLKSTMSTFITVHSNLTSTQNTTENNRYYHLNKTNYPQMNITNLMSSMNKAKENGAQKLYYPIVDSILSLLILNYIFAIKFCF